jgi:GTP-binding protein Era
MAMSQTPTSVAVAAIIGAPNAGKSTLVNALVGQKVAIVTHKVQTTRTPLRGIAIRGDVQIILIDTPGVFSPRRRLDKAMVQAAWMSVDHADAVVHVVDAPAHARSLDGGRDGADLRTRDDVDRIIAALKDRQIAAFLCLNKVDAMARSALLAVVQDLKDKAPYTDVFMISAETGDGVADLGAALAARAKPGPWLYPRDQAADAPSRQLAAEITREKLMLRLHDEIPYEAMVETESWQERKDGSVRIEQTIFVAREGQRRIAIGEKGATIKIISTMAREDLETTFERRVHLFVTVKVREGWADERARYRDLGLDYDAP